MALTKVRGLGLGSLDDNITFSTAGKGVHLGVTSATASNLIDDYEEGTWTPSFNNVAIQEGVYVKIGSMVFCTARIQTTSGGASGTTISGLPFTSFNSNASRGGGLVTYQDEIQTQTFAILVEANNTVITIRVGSTDKEISASKTAFISFSYRVA